MMPVTVRPRATVASLLRYSDPEITVAPTPAAPSPAVPASPPLEGKGGAFPSGPGPLSREERGGEKPSPAAASESATSIPKGILVSPTRPPRPAPAPETPCIDPLQALSAVPPPPVTTTDEQKPSLLTDPAGPGALLVGLAALACVWVQRLSGLVIPLGIFGLLWGVIALMVAGSVGRPRGRAAIGTALSVVALSIAMFPTSIFRSSGVTAPSAVVPVSTWADASRGDQKQGSVTLQVVSVELGTMEAPPAQPMKSAAPAKTATAREKVLFVRLRAKRGGETTADAKLWREKPKATLADGSGHSVATRPGSSVTGSDALLIFEAPPRVRKFLRLEVPASALGTTGSFRFMIPPAMIATDPSDANPKFGR